MTRIPLFLALLAVLALPASAGAKTVLPQYHGIQVTGIGGATEAHMTSDLAQARALGANVVRTDIDWGAFEPRQGEYDAQQLAKADHFFAQAHKRGLKVLLTIVGTPCWNTTAPAPAAECATDGQRYEAQRYQPRDLAAFAKVAAFAAGRWSADIAALEVWNEPDQRNQLYWAGDQKVERYAEMLKLAYPAIKQAAPNVTVLAGAIVGGNGAFLEALYKQGIKGSYDALSVHYYDLVLYQLGTIRAMRKKYGDRSPMWLGEWGYTSCLTKRVKTQLGGHACVTRRNQARFSLDVLRALQRQKDVQGATIFKLRDDGTYDFGALTTAGKRKPLFTALRNAFRGRLGKAAKVRVKLRRSKGRVIASGSAPAGDVLQLDAFVGRTVRYRAAFRLDRNGRFAIKLPKQLGTRNLSVAVTQFTVRGRVARARLR